MSGCAVHAGTLYWTTLSGGAIYRADLATKAVAKVATIKFAGDGAVTLQNVAYDATYGSLYVADSQGSADAEGYLYKVDPNTGAYAQQSIGRSLKSPYGVAVSGTTLYVSDSDLYKIYSTEITADGLSSNYNTVYSTQKSASGEPMGIALL